MITIIRVIIIKLKKEMTVCTMTNTQKKLMMMKEVRFRILNCLINIKIKKLRINKKIFQINKIQNNIKVDLLLVSNSQHLFHKGNSKILLVKNIKIPIILYKAKMKLEILNIQNNKLNYFRNSQAVMLILRWKIKKIMIIIKAKIFKNLKMNQVTMKILNLIIMIKMIILIISRIKIL